MKVKVLKEFEAEGTRYEKGKMYEMPDDISGETAIKAEKKGFIEPKGETLVISYEPGSKNEKDRLIKVDTLGGEVAVSIFRVALLVNQLAVNEKKINAYVFEEGLPFYYERVIKGAIEHAKRGIDWAEPENVKHIEELCEENDISRESIDYDLLSRTQHRKLAEFEK